MKKRTTVPGRTPPARPGTLRTLGAGAAAAFASLLTAGCAQHTPGRVFATPEEAVSSVVVSLRANDKQSLSKILGSDSKGLIASGDDVADARNAADFLAKYDQVHRLVPAENGEAMTLEVGTDGWPLPIPIVKDRDGWRFDTAAGLDEMLNRRIGRNELDTIETCRSINDAQHEYRALNPRGSATPEYAQRVISSEGSRDGLFWPVDEGQAMSPMGAVAAQAFDEGYSGSGKGGPYHGYMYRLLTAQGPFAAGGRKSYLTGDRLTGGYAIVAYPAQYGNSGIMTFIMNHQGILYQRDLGSGTASAAKAMREFNPGPEWQVVE